MVNMKKLLSLVLAACMLLGMASVSLAETTDAAEATRDENTLVIGYTEFNEKFSPFYGETAYDNDVAVKLVGEELAVLDRQGAIVFNGIEGETIPFNGVDHTYPGIADLKVERDEAANKTVYTAKLREDVKFSDGTPMTADDLIFTYYVQLDPSYTGPSTLNSYDIVGLKAYRRKVVKSIEVYGEMHRFIPVLAKQAGFRRIGEKVVRHRARKYGVSKFGWERMIKGYLDLITVMFMTRFGKSPMYFFGGLGTLMFLLGGATAVYLIAEKLYKQAHGLLVRGVTDQPLFYIALAAALAGCGCIERVYPSQANFLLVKTADPDRLYGELIAAGVIVRNRTRIAGCEGCLRITVGTPAENGRMLETVKNFRP